MDEQDVPDCYCSASNQDGDFDDVDPSPTATDAAAFPAKLLITRGHAAA